MSLAATKPRFEKHKSSQTTFNYQLLVRQCRIADLASAIGIYLKRNNFTVKKVEIFTLTRECDRKKRLKGPS